MNLIPEDSEIFHQYGLIGYPVSTSLSPVIFEYIFQRLSLSAVYRAWEVKEEAFTETVLRFRHTLDGWNVTIPYKRRILSYLDDVDEPARRIGAVNCVRNDHGRLSGYNTDYIGFTAMAEPHRNEIDLQRGLILGSGGAARAVIYSLLRFFRPHTIRIWNRTQSSAFELVRDLQMVNPDIPLLVTDVPSLNAFRPSFIINCLPHQAFENWFKKYALPIYSNPYQPVWLDINYYPVNTDLKEMNKSHFRDNHGLDMLVVQALRSLEIWTGKSFDSGEILHFLHRRKE